MQISFTGKLNNTVTQSLNRVTSSKYDSKKINELLKIKVDDVLEAKGNGEHYQYRGILQLKNGSQIILADNFLHIEKKSREMVGSAKDSSLIKNTTKSSGWSMNTLSGEPLHEKLNKAIKYLASVIEQFRAAQRKDSTTVIDTSEHIIRYSSGSSGSKIIL